MSLPTHALEKLKEEYLYQAESMSPEVVRTQDYLRNHHLDPVYLKKYNQDEAASSQQNFYQYINSTKLKVMSDIQKFRTQAVVDRKR